MRSNAIAVTWKPGAFTPVYHRAKHAYASLSHLCALTIRSKPKISHSMGLSTSHSWRPGNFCDCWLFRCAANAWARGGGGPQNIAGLCNSVRRQQVCADKNNFPHKSASVPLTYRANTPPKRNDNKPTNISNHHAENFNAREWRNCTVAEHACSKM